MFDRVPQAEGIDLALRQWDPQKIAAMDFQAKVLTGVAARLHCKVATAHLPVGARQAQEQAVRAADLEDLAAGREPSPKLPYAAREVGLMSGTVGIELGLRLGHGIDALLQLSEPCLTCRRVGNDGQQGEDAVAEGLVFDE